MEYQGEIKHLDAYIDSLVAEHAEADERFIPEHDKAYYSAQGNFESDEEAWAQYKEDCEAAEREYKENALGDIDVYAIAEEIDKEVVRAMEALRQSAGLV